MFCEKCGKEINDQAVICVGCGCPTARPQPIRLEPDIPSTGLNVLCFFFPIIGLILYIVWNKDYPLKAKGCGKWALIGVCASVGFMILYFIFIFGLMFTMMR